MQVQRVALLTDGWRRNTERGRERERQREGEREEERERERGRERRREREREVRQREERERGTEETIIARKMHDKSGPPKEVAGAA